MTHEKRRYSAEEMLENATEWEGVRIHAAQLTADMLRQAASTEAQAMGLVDCLEFIEGRSTDKAMAHAARLALSKFRGGENEAV